MAIEAIREHYNRHYEGRVVDALEKIVTANRSYAEDNRIVANFS